MVAIIDYDAGNINSVQKAVEYLGSRCIITSDRKEIIGADEVILPGVGSFGDAAERLRDRGLDEVIKDVIEKDIPFLGICLGLQLLFEKSEESPGAKGLGIFRGSIKRLPSDAGLKVPDIGWNSIDLVSKGRLFEGIEDGSFMYFVHSYYADSDDKSIVKAQIDYGVKADVSVESGNVFACQFHPEKSSENGLKILENFLRI